MLIEAVDIKIITQNGEKYGRNVDFTNEGKTKEINLIYGENTLGKSTLIESIIYGLSGEEIYGQKRKNDVADYSLIIENFFQSKISESYINLQLFNGKDRVVVSRDTLYRDEPIIVYYDSKIDNFKKSKKIEFYKAKKDKNIRGNKTYQEFLFDYLNIPKYRNMSDFEGGKEEDGSSLIFYIQNLMPLFVINQLAWGDIQAINPRYGLKDVKKIAFEIIMGFSNTKNISDKFILNLLNSELKQKRVSLNDVEEVLATTQFKEEEQLNEQTKKLQEELISYNEELKKIEEDEMPDIDTLKPMKDKYRRLMSLSKRHEEQINGLDQEIGEYDYYINKILMDIEKLDKLRTAKKLIGSLPVKKCPHCHNKVTIDENYEVETNHCSLCSNEMMSKNYSKTDELLGYLIDEEKDFQRLKNMKQKEKVKIESDLFIIKLDLLEIQKTIEDLQGDLKPYNYKRYHLISREIGRINNTINSLEKDREIVVKYEGLKTNIQTLNNKIEEIKEGIKNNEVGVDDKTKIKFFERKFKEYLFGLDFLKDGVDYNRIIDAHKEISLTNKDTLVDEISKEIYENIIIDREDYSPKLEDRNLYSITSSSGLIRIILAYYLALLRTGLEYKNATNHPLLLILDEPRQQNLDLDSYIKFTDLLRGLQIQFPGQFQIIMASGDKGSLSEEDISLNLNKNYLIEKR
ncbi:hypothetical protein [Bacillus sp. AFS018417]|uniref:hypothetical protein n=1 Tax=Bacillus sp. AFS018417 TaxID=2033491 RepID=UPI0020D2607F|nr:hypothetical protein [Bacillus sp. AFS018417]